MIEVRDAFSDLVSDAAELGHDLLLGSYGTGWIIKSDVVSVPYVSRKERAALPSIVADSYHVVERLTKELVDALGARVAQVDIYFAHDSDSLWMYTGSRPRSR
jgi:hypothetical protein